MIVRVGKSLGKAAAAIGFSVVCVVAAQQVQMPSWSKVFGYEPQHVNRDPRIGMTEDAARLRWGKPDEINKSVYSSLVHEQWVYDAADRRLYFDNGKLTGIQEPGNE